MGLTGSKERVDPGHLVPGVRSVCNLSPRRNPRQEQDVWVECELRKDEDEPAPGGEQAEAGTEEEDGGEPEGPA